MARGCVVAAPLRKPDIAKETRRRVSDGYPDNSMAAARTRRLR